MTQLTLGLDRDSGLVAAPFGDRDPAVKLLISAAIGACKARDEYVGICGQARVITLISPSDQDIDSISLNPDTVVDTWIRLGRARQTHVP